MTIFFKGRPRSFHPNLILPDFPQEQPRTFLNENSGFQEAQSEFSIIQNESSIVQNDLSIVQNESNLVRNDKSKNRFLEIFSIV